MVSLTHKLLYIILLIQPPAFDAEAAHGVVCAADGHHLCPCVIVGGAPRGTPEHHATAATKLLVELLLEGLAQQIKGEGVEAGVSEGQDTRYDAAH